MNEDLRKRIIDSVSEEPDLMPEEKETNVRFAKDQDHLTIFTAESAIMRRLLAHPEIEIDLIRQTTSEGPVTIRSDELEEEFDGRRRTVGLKVTGPVGLLFIKSKSRKSSGHADVVSNTASDISLS